MYFLEYFEVVQNALADPKCYGIIKNAIRDTEYYLQSGSSGIRKIQTDYKWDDGTLYYFHNDNDMQFFSLCKPVDVENLYDKAYFYNSIANEFAGIVQYATGNALSNTCNELMDSSLPNDYTRLIRFISRRRPNCVGNYDNFVRYFQQTNIGGDSKLKIFFIDFYWWM